MAIQFIDNQPLTFQDNFPTGGECLLGQQEYCTKYNNGDHIYAQWKIEPCNPVNLICNPTFMNDEPEGVVDPSMTNGSADWTATTGNWNWDNVNYRWFSSGSGIHFNGLRGDLNGNVSSGYACEVIFTIGGGSGGTITPVLGGSSGTPVYLPGTYRQIIYYGGSGNQITFDDFNYDGWIDNVSVKFALINDSLQNCWASSPQAEVWDLNYAGCITKKPGTPDDIINSIYGAVPNMYVKFSCNVSNVTNGQMLVKDGTTLLFTIDQNGYYEKYFHMQTSSLVFDADANFDGTLCDLSLIKYEQDITVTLQSLSGGPTYDFTNDATYYEDRILFDRLINAGIQSGCYQVCIEYGCAEISEYPYCEDPDLTKDNLEVKDQLGNNSITYGSGNIVIDMCPNGPSLVWIVDNGYGPPSQPLTQFNYNITTGPDTNSGSQLFLSFPGCATQFLIVGSAQPNTTYTGTITLGCQPNAAGYTLSVYTPGVPDNCARFSLVHLEITALIENDVFPITYCSNCINIQQHHNCSLFVGGYCGEDSFGFKFPQGQLYPWRIGARVKAVMINPKYTGELKRYADSEGRLIVTKANSNKIYQLLIDYVDERSHDWLRTAFLCDTIEIGDITYSEDYFVGTDGDYEPEWPSNLGNFNLAQARVNLQRKTDVIYNNNAG